MQPSALCHVSGMGFSQTDTPRELCKSWDRSEVSPRPGSALSVGKTFFRDAVMGRKFRLNSQSSKPSMAGSRGMVLSGH